ncbi:hypothetical protein [Allorhizobium borbori]|uniref:Uncharacterized protein n=1 Tax=Allorhizobium borbori TaxID=485907 RepID=A0A7W6K467_9HYPH|nr:hypothetical protein [Allorhizobium borbori]MBB4103745.1 hypothetical protein [Allorhizobium borbori]
MNTKPVFRALPARQRPWSTAAPHPKCAADMHIDDRPNLLSGRTTAP